MENGNSLAEENFKLREELSQCKDDKEFVWMLWKDLQKQSPDITSTIDMIITREELKHEQTIRELTATVQSKQQEAEALSHVLEEREQVLMEQNAKLSEMETEIAVLEGKVQSQQLQLEKQVDKGQADLLIMEKTCAELERELETEKKSLYVHNEEMKRILLNSEEQLRKYNELKLDNDSKETLIQHLNQEKVHLKERVDDFLQQKAEYEQTLHQLQTELQSIKSELSEVSRSRDAWASHTTLQSSTIQRLQRENCHLKNELSRHSSGHKDCVEERGDRGGEGERRVRELGEDEGTGGECLERVEKELFDTKLQLKAKCTELESLRSAHDRRMKRMHSLQTSHKLLKEQLLTYEENSSADVPKVKPRKAAVKALRHENSTAVWSELALYRTQCHQQQTLLLELEEERDMLKAKFLRSETERAELSTQLQLEKNDLERKLSAIAKVEDLAGVQSCELQLKNQICELEGAVSELKHEKATLQSEKSSTEKELFRVREDAAQMQVQIMELTHRKKLQQLQMLSKATMTDNEGSPCHYESILMTDSATQVDSSSLRPDVRDAGVSPVRSQNTQQHREVATQTSICVEDRPLRAHRRTRSEGDSLFYKKKAEDAFCRVKKISKQLQDISLSKENRDHQQHTNSGAPEIMEQCSECERRVKPLPSNPNQKTNSLSSTLQVSGPHKCAFQQQVKTLQKKLRTLNRQLAVACTARQCLSQSLEDERRERGKARTEVKELTLRLHGMKTVVQSLQGEVNRVSAVNQQLQQKMTLLTETRKRRTEAEWKNIESEKQVLSDRCSVLSESLKSLEEKLQLKTSEMEETRDRFGRMERDLRQKRQLLDAQRDKMKMLAQQAADDQAKAQEVECEMQSLKEATVKSRHQIESLRNHLARQKEEKSKVMRLLADCQDELAQTLQQLSESQRECDKKKLLLVQMKCSSEQEVKKLRQKHAEIVEKAQHKFDEQQKLMKDQLREKERFLQEHRQFVKDLAICVEQNQRQRRQSKSYDEESTRCTVVSSRVREIAKTTLHLSDLDIDDFFSDTSHTSQQQQTATDSFVVGNLEDHLSKLPFASTLVQQFMRILM